MRRPLVIAGIGLVALGAAAWTTMRWQRTSTVARAASDAPAASIAAAGIGCLGRIEPEGGVVSVTAPYYESRPSLVAQLMVGAGDWVEKDQRLAVLDSRRLLDAAFRQADARVALAQQKVNQVRAGAKLADIRALEAVQARLQASLAQAEAELTRHASLLRERVTTQALVDEKTLAVATVKREIEETGERIRALTEVRPSDVHVAESEVAAAVADRDRVAAQLEAATVKAPFAGRVLAIHARPGEEVGSKGLLDLAATRTMYIVAEVYESDVPRVQVGRKASARSPLAAYPLRGTVERVERQVGAPTVLPADPLAFADNRVVKVFIRLDDGRPAESLIHGRVDVTIEP